MRSSQPFARAIALAAARAAAMPRPLSEQQGRSNRRPAGAHKAAHRAAMKLRNKKAH